MNVGVAAGTFSWLLLATVASGDVGRVIHLYVESGIIINFSFAFPRTRPNGHILKLCGGNKEGLIVNDQLFKVGLLV